MLTQEETSAICGAIAPQRKRVAVLYDYAKYPVADYNRFCEMFSALPQLNREIQRAMEWKWGHWGKDNYPNSHKALIQEIKNSWTAFVNSNAKQTPAQTFLHWQNTLLARTRYITVAWITHLVHPKSIPIIDQHNFRAMNHFLRLVRPNHYGNKKPSTWAHILSLKDFISLISVELNVSREELDRFLMMFGKHFAVR